MSSFLSNSRSLMAICLAMFLALSCQNAPSDAAAVTPIEVRLQEVLRLGDDEEAGIEYVFGIPEDICVDSHGNIYISDRQAFGVKVYDKAGTYLRTLGGVGQGPGQFMDLTGMTITDEDVLVVSDARNKRITTFSSAGHVLDTYPLAGHLMQYARWLQQRADGMFLVASLPFETQEDPDKLFHMYTPDFQEKITAFGSRRLREEEDDAYKRIYGSRVGSVWAEEEQLVYAPRYYHGKVYILEKQDGLWQVADTLSGYVNQTKAMTIVKEEPVELPHFAAIAGSIGFIFHNESLGLWRLQNGHLVHFTFIQDRNERVFGVEIYDEVNQFLGYGEIERVKGTIGKHKIAIGFMQPKWKDAQDTFYFIYGPKKVRAYTLDYTIPQVNP